MKEKYAIRGSNTLFKVWGIIQLVFTAITGILCLLSLVMILGASSAVMNRYGSLMGYMPDSVAGSVVLVLVIAYLIIAIVLAISTAAGLLLVRDYINSKETLMVFAVLYFLAAALSVFGFIMNIVAGAGVFTILIVLIGIAWRTGTGVLLIMKRNRAVPVNGYSNNGNVNQWVSPDGGSIGNGSIISQEQQPVPAPQPIGIIEGQFGVCKGRRFELYAGKTYRIGRESGCEIQVNHPKVSRVHCTVCKLPNGRYQITDSSSNGTYYENQMLPKGVASEVIPGGMLVLGEADNVLQLM